MEPYLVIFLVVTLWITINILNLQQSSLNKYQLEQYFEKFYSCRVPFSFIVFSQITFLYSVTINIDFLITVLHICLLNHRGMNRSYTLQIKYCLFNLPMLSLLVLFLNIASSYYLVSFHFSLKVLILVFGVE